MKKIRRLKHIVITVLTFAIIICGFAGFSTINASAENSANDVTVTIDTGASITLKDINADGYYEIGTADELYALAVAVNVAYDYRSHILRYSRK